VPLFSLLTFALLSPALELLASLPILFGSDSIHIGVCSFFFENVCRSYFVALGGFVGYLQGVSINKALKLAVMDTQPVSRIFLQVSMLFWMTFLALLASALYPMFIYSHGFSSLLKQKAYAIAKDEKFCVVGPSLAPVQSFEDIDFWMLVAESVKFKLGLPNRVSEASGPGSPKRRGIHLGILVGTRGYHWSFRYEKFIENHYYSFFNSPNKFAEPRADCQDAVSSAKSFHSVSPCCPKFNQGGASDVRSREPLAIRENSLRETGSPA
jgi:hypothetical protein